jgi:hypothetical protein
MANISMLVKKLKFPNLMFTACDHPAKKQRGRRP